MRNPVERFYSSLKQSIVQGGKPPGMRRGTRLATLTPKELRMEHVDELLTRMTDGRCSFDHHLESQALSLSSPATAGDDYFSSKSTNKTARNMMIPLDFIGRSEHLLSVSDELAVVRAFVFCVKFVLACGHLLASLAKFIIFYRIRTL